MRKSYLLLLAAVSGLLMWSCGEEEFGNSDLSSTPKTRSAASIDFTAPEGTFVVCEGNMSDSNGTIVYYDENGQEYRDVFEQANGGREIGNVLQDMYMANDRIYFITQNGDVLGGQGRLVICDAHTLALIRSYNLNELKTPAGKNTWPQHLVVTGPSKAYIQYSESGMEATSGIAELDLIDFGDSDVQVVGTIDGTFGTFTSVGATKARMVYSRGKIYAGCGYSVISIDPATGVAETLLTYEGQQVKGVVKGADGNIYFALAGRFDGGMYSPTFTSRPLMVCMDHSGNIVKEVEMPEPIQLPVASWSPAINMAASFTDPYIYFVDTDEFSAASAARYDYTSDTFVPNFIPGGQTIYGIMGQHPTTKELWVGKSDYVSSDIYRYNVSQTGSVVEIGHINYGSRKWASPAGIDFAYRFTQAYINK